jgi:hypothetical protein
MFDGIAIFLPIGAAPLGGVAPHLTHQIDAKEGDPDEGSLERRPSIDTGSLLQNTL